MAVDERPFALSMISLLLLDLDGVVAIEMVPPQVARLEIILLHELLHEMLSGISVPVVVLTHRSRAEANLILQLAGLTSKEVAGVIAAEDILRAAVKSSRRWLLLRHGLKKSWILPDVEKRYGVARRDIAIIDDRTENLEDMLGNGMGLGILAPSGITADGTTLVSFDFQHMLRFLQDWKGEKVPHIHTLASREMRIERWCRTGVSTNQGSGLIFNKVRRCGRMIRRLVGTL